MTRRTQDVLREALALPDRERADIAAQLIASLDVPEDPATIEAEWAAEIERRAERGPERRIARGIPGCGPTPRRRAPPRAVSACLISYS